MRRRTGRHASRGAASCARATRAWLRRPAGRATAIGTVTLGVVISVSPAIGASSGSGSGTAGGAHGVSTYSGAGSARQPVLATAGKNGSGQAFSGTAAVGALFTSSKNNQPGTHFCTASVVNSTHGDIAITAAHCVTGVPGTILFVPGYSSGSKPYGVWEVTKVYVDKAWSSGSSQNDDVAFIQLSQQGSSTPIEDVTGAEQLSTTAPAKDLVEVIGYPDQTDQPVICENWTTQPMADQLEFDCGGYTDGTSGGPFLADVSQSTGQGTVIGVIGGYEQGGYTPQVSYSSQFGQGVAELYATAEAGG